MNAAGGLRNLSRNHGLKVPVGVVYSVEECCEAVGEVVGCASVKAASRMNSAVVIFLDAVEKVNAVVEHGIVLRDTHTTVFPLVSPAKKIILSNLPPFISDVLLERELSRHGQIVSAMKAIPSGCKAAALKHVVSFRRQLYMILKNGVEELNVVMKFKVDGFDYNIFATTATMKCFGCGGEGHLVRSCPNAQDAQEAQPAPQREAAVIERGEEKGGAAAQPQGEEGAAAAPQVEQEKEGGVAAHRQPETDMQQDTEGSQTATTSNTVVSAVRENDENEALVTETESSQSQNAARKDEAVFKVPNLNVGKRKKPKNQSGGTKSKKMLIKETMQESGADVSSEIESEIDLSDSSLPDGQLKNGYSLLKIRSFLEKTKGKRDVKVEEYFPDTNLFIQSARWLMKARGSDGFRNTEVFRLKKLIQRVQKESDDE